MFGMTRGTLVSSVFLLFEPDTKKWSLKNFKVDFLENYASDRPNVKTKNDRLHTQNTIPMTDFFYFEVLGR